MRSMATHERSETIESSSQVKGAHDHKTKRRAKIWIDLDNSPHVPFFVPIIEELEKRGYSVLLTARDCFQVRGLVKLSGLHCTMIGRHYGKNKLLKVVGTLIRAAELLCYGIWERPDFSISHGSRAQLAACAVLGVRRLMMDDYEHSDLFFKPDWLMVPEVLVGTESRTGKQRILTYPGIKEDAYVPRFTPDPAVRLKLGLFDSHLVVTVRPPADEAHYHNPESDTLFRAVVEHLLCRSDIKIVLVPRTLKQAERARAVWPHGFATGKLVIPTQTVDGLSLIWWSDLVISGGGTMNREAAALGVPVFSIFRGPIGAVDRDLVSAGRLTLLERIEDVPAKLILQSRAKTAEVSHPDNRTLKAIIENIIRVMEPLCKA